MKSTDDSNVKYQMKNLIVTQKFDNVKMIREVLGRARTGLWIIELEDGASPRMYADETMLELLGLPEHPSPELCYEHWFGRIDPDSRGAVQNAVAQASAHAFAEVQYPWDHPVWGRIFVRCGGVLSRQGSGVVAMSGYHQNITDLVSLTQENKALQTNNEELLDSLHNMFFSLYRLDLSTAKVLPLRVADDLPSMTEISYREFVEDYSSPLVHPDDYDDFRKTFTLEQLLEL